MDLTFIDLGVRLRVPIHWGRIRAYRKNWATTPQGAAGDGWPSEFSRLMPRKELYQDCFIILNYGSYRPNWGWHPASGGAASLRISCKHESTHCFTRRVFGSMRNNILDELIADYMGIVATTGGYRADCFLRFVGLDVFPDGRPDGRINTGATLLCMGSLYRAQTPRQDGAAANQQTLTAPNVQSWPWPA